MLAAAAVFVVPSLLTFGLGTARANLLANPGFETGDFSDWTLTDRKSRIY